MDEWNWWGVTWLMTFVCIHACLWVDTEDSLWTNYVKMSQVFVRVLWVFGEVLHEFSFFFFMDVTSYDVHSLCNNDCRYFFSLCRRSLHPFAQLLRTAECRTDLLYLCGVEEQAYAAVFHPESIILSHHLCSIICCEHCHASCNIRHSVTCGLFVGMSTSFLWTYDAIASYSSPVESWHWN